MKFDPNSNICFLCGDKVLTNYDDFNRLKLSCSKFCFYYVKDKCFLIDKAMFVKNKFPNIYIYIYFYLLQESKVLANNWEYIFLFDIINREDIKYLSQVQIINKVINYCENLVFL